MDRLTKKYAGGYGLAKVKDNEQALESPYPNTLRACFESWQRLGAYEDTGMTPDKIDAMKAELDALKADIEAGRLVRLPAAIGQLVFVPVEDGGMYAPYVNGIAFLRPDAHDAVMEAVTTVGIDRERLTFMIARENKGTHWFETEEEARAALGREDAR